MIIEFSVCNFKSIADKQTFSMIADKGDELEKNVLTLEEPKKLRLLRSAAIYGANAAGKSNFITAITTMSDIVVESATNSKASDLLPISNFRLSESFNKSPSEFEVNFIADGVRFQYGFSATKEHIVDEWLFAFPKGRSQKWFIRLWDENKKEYDWDLGSALTGEKQTWMKSTRPNALFLSTAVQLNSQQLKPVYDWFNYKLKYTALSGWSHDFTAKQCLENKDDILKFLKAADVGIDDIVVKKERFDPSQVPDDMPEALRDLIIQNMKDKDEYVIQTVHKNAEGKLTLFDLEDESHGTKKIFRFSGPLLHTLTKGNVLFIDELNDNLHPKLVEFIVSLFNNPDLNINGAQLIFSTHETSILSQKVFRRDQIWFTEKGSNSATKLFPLSEFSPRKGRENLEASYLDGRYGALPFVGKVEKVDGI